MGSFGGYGPTQAAAQGPGYMSYYQNVDCFNGMVTGASAITQTSGSSIFVQPFMLPMPVSLSYVRFLASFNDSAVGTAQTTSANTTMSCAIYTTIALVVYSQGAGASSRSLMSMASTSGGITGATYYQAAGAGNNYTMTVQKTFMDIGNNTQGYTSSYPVTSTQIVISSNSNTLFTGQRFLDIPWATSFSQGNYWLAIGASSSSASNANSISFCSTNIMPMSLAGISQSNVSVGRLGAATSASDQQLLLGLGMWSTNSSSFSQAAIGMNSISALVSNPILFFQFVRQA